MCDGQPSNSVEATALHGIFRLAPAGWPSPLFGFETVGFTAAAFVARSARGLPFASVSKGTFAGMLVPRRRMYCDPLTFSILNVITLNSLSCLSVAQVWSLNVLMTAAVVFFAPAGTLAKFGFLIQSLGHW